MNELRDILKEEYIKKEEDSFTPQSLMKMIEEVLDVSFPIVEGNEQASSGDEPPKKLTIDLIPTIPIDEIGWGSLVTPEGGGTLVRTSAGEQLAQYLKHLGGENLPQKLDNLKKYMESPTSVVTSQNPRVQIQQVIANLVFYKTLTSIITNFNASSAGFAFESFMAILLDAKTGRQVPATEGSTIADIILDAGGLPISLKLYKEGSLKVGGSYKQLVQDLTDPEGGGLMQYVAVTKDVQQTKVSKGGGKTAIPPSEQSGKLNFYAFNFTRDNFLDILALGGPKEKDLFAIPRYLAQKGRPNVAELDAAFSRGTLQQLLTYPAKTFINLKPIVDTFVDTLKDDIKTMFPDNPDVGEAIARIFEEKFNNLVNREDGTYLAKPNLRFAVNPPRARGLPELTRDIMAAIAAEQPPPGLDPKVIKSIDKRFKQQYRARFSEAETTRKGIKKGTARKEKFAELGGFATGRQSLKALKKIKEEGSDELFNLVMQSTSGYLKNKQFDLSKSNLDKIGNLPSARGEEEPAPSIPPELAGGPLLPQGELREITAKGSNLPNFPYKGKLEVGVIEIGGAKIQEMLDESIKQFNSGIYSIFLDLKDLTTNLNSYVAGGLKETDKATDAIEDAGNIATGTEELATPMPGEEVFAQGQLKE